MTDYSEKAIWYQCFTAALSGSVHTSVERMLKPVEIAKLCRDIADAATKEALARWPHEPK